MLSTNQTFNEAQKQRNSIDFTFIQKILFQSSRMQKVNFSNINSAKGNAMHASLALFSRAESIKLIWGKRSIVGCKIQFLIVNPVKHSATVLLK